MSYVMVYAKQTAGSPIGGQPLTVEAIKRAFLRIQRRATADAGVARVLGLGDFVGPNPRVTREAQPAPWSGDLVYGGAITHASWLMDLPDSLSSDPAARAEFRHLQLVRTRDQLLDNLRREEGGDHWDVEIRGYDPAHNGTVEWWQSGRAASDATHANTWPVFRTGDNPIGPNDTPYNLGLDLTPPLPGLPRGVSGLGWWLAIGAGVLAAVYVAPPLLRMWGSNSGSRASETPRPSRARARARR